jgi:hypothetical protein
MAETRNDGNQKTGRRRKDRSDATPKTSRYSPKNDIEEERNNGPTRGGRMGKRAAQLSPQELEDALTPFADTVEDVIEENWPKGPKAKTMEERPLEMWPLGKTFRVIPVRPPVPWRNRPNHGI